MPLAMRPLREENGALPTHFSSRPRHSLRRRRLARGLRPVQVWLGGSTPKEFTWESSSTPNKFTWESGTPRISVRGSQTRSLLPLYAERRYFDEEQGRHPGHGCVAYSSYVSNRGRVPDTVIREIAPFSRVLCPTDHSKTSYHPKTSRPRWLRWRGRPEDE